MTRGLLACLSTAAAAFIAVSAADGSAAAPPTPEQLPHAPRIFSAVEVVRKVPQGYLVTSTALIPFAAEVRDERGLQRLAYIVTAARLDAAGKVGREGKEQTIPLDGFTQLLRRGSVREFRTAADDASSALDLSKLPQLFPKADADQPPCRYRLRVWLEATDNDNKTGRSEPVIFVVVSERELLSEVANEEELLQLDLEDRVAGRLRRARSELQRLIERLPTATPDQLPDLYRRASEVEEAVNRAAERVQDVHTGFRRIVRELQANRVRADMIDRVKKTVCGPLDVALRREFPRAAEALGEWCKRLDGVDAAQARKDGARAANLFDDLVGRIGKAVDATRDLEKVNRQIRMLLKTQQDVEHLLWDMP